MLGPLASCPFKVIVNVLGHLFAKPQESRSSPFSSSLSGVVFLVLLLPPGQAELEFRNADSIGVPEEERKVEI
jgi:hypothetical protein